MKKKIIICAVAVILLTLAVFIVLKVIIPDWRYMGAISLFERGEYSEAIDAFQLLDGYKDSEEKIEICEKAIKEAEYDYALSLFENEKYGEAKAAFEALEDFGDSAEQIKKCDNAIKEVRYGKAVALFDAEKFDEAVSIFKELDGYKDSGAYLKTASLKNVSVGDTILFGKYEQDNNPSTKNEPVEWLVLDITENKMLIVSKFALDQKRYNETSTDITWENCSIRKWLNDDFLFGAFDDSEREMILLSEISADKNPEYDTDQGNETQDKVFLLSVTEANKYFTSGLDRRCNPTEYAVSNGADANADSGAGFWWLRTLGCDNRDAVSVNSSGAVFLYGDYLDFDFNAVRPAMWIEIG